ncbi:response regulator (plasmid) [Streptomyces sp. NBC_00841]|uniref:response regulator transcription factor n=1 Tax=unclassified Streptomyces TaxID=2593676 RepID=UPI0022566C18|nr:MULTISPECIES: response regulator [unclassified Streptomyces]MCX4537817.1 response regulator [Streptomyces sp. NBC_01669]WSA05017.1 response regulator [Streptomyces sp. NBC_00841]
MTASLTRTRILVADDQSDVARTLCRPLQKAGARLHFVTDGHTALEEIAAQPYDLVLIDMKMPPDEWGGLWLLRELQNGGWGIPTLVLSGEGSKQQVIEAVRLGVTDWIVKDAAGEELLERCVKVLTDALDQSLDVAGARLPAPLAHRFARYDRSADPDKKVFEGLLTLESVFRFVAVLGLSNTPPAPLRGITAQRFAAPSMGTWFDVCAALASLPGAGDTFARLFSCLVSERADRQPALDLVAARNGLAHGRSTLTAEEAGRLDGLLRRFAHRALASWRAELAVPTSMTYDGATYSVDVLSLRGTGKPTPGKITTQAPVVTGQPFIVSRDADPIPLAPWMLVHRSAGSDFVRCLQFDGLKRGKGNLDAGTPFMYAKTDEGDDVPVPGHAAATWRTLSPWATP